MSLDKMSMLGLTGGLKLDSREETIVTFIKHITNNLDIQKYFMSMEFTLLVVDFVQNGVCYQRIQSKSLEKIVVSVIEKVFERTLTKWQQQKVSDDVNYLCANKLTTHVNDSSVYARKLANFFFR